MSDYDAYLLRRNVCIVWFIVVFIPDIFLAWE